MCTADNLTAGIMYISLWHITKNLMRKTYLATLAILDKLTMCLHTLYSC